MDEFQDLPRQFGQVWSSKKFNGFDILLVVLGGSMKWKEGEFYGRAMAELPRIIFRASTRELEIRKTGSDKIAEV